LCLHLPFCSLSQRPFSRNRLKPFFQLTGRLTCCSRGYKKVDFFVIITKPLKDKYLITAYTRLKKTESLKNGLKTFFGNVTSTYHAYDKKKAKIRFKDILYDFFGNWIHSDSGPLLISHSSQV